VNDRLGRNGSPVPAVRLVHLGLGNFFRAHQAVYTAAVPGWGIAAFTGRSPRQAQLLARQDGLYTLIVRGSAGDRCTVIDSVARAHAAGEHAAWLTYLADPAVVAVTITVTEAAYLRAAITASDPALAADIAALRADPSAAVATVPARLVAGLAARRRAGAGPLAVVPCDNLPDNGTTVREIVRAVADELDPGLSRWVQERVSFVTTVVDRITPRSTAADRREVYERTGRRDDCVVVTEPFSEWVLSGTFPAGRPAWEDAGARFTADVRPFEQRKLWLLNGAHSLLAYAGSIRGHETVADAVADPRCRDWVEQWWDVAQRHLELPAGELVAYRDALRDRFANAAIAHRLAQIAADGSQKLPIRVLPVLDRERAAGRMPSVAALIIAAWLQHLRGRGAPVADVDATRARAAARGPLPAAVRSVLDYLQPGLGADRDLAAAVLAAAEQF
jgi:fructuronate reductase